MLDVCVRLDMDVLYDSSIRFNERIYMKSGLNLTHVKLGRTLREIISRPLIFVREYLSKDTFDALNNLHQVRTLPTLVNEYVRLFQLIHIGKLNVSTQLKLFPTIDMINALNSDFGVQLTDNEIQCKRQEINVDVVRHVVCSD
jgi:hypothetical protein